MSPGGRSALWAIVAASPDLEDASRVVSRHRVPDYGRTMVRNPDTRVSRERCAPAPGRNPDRVCNPRAVSEALLGQLDLLTVVG
jgi:hypothetical protein